MLQLLTPAVSQLEMPASHVMAIADELHMDALSSGALMALCWAFWRGKARALPEDDAALAVLAKCHTRRWYEVKSRVIPALNRATAVLSSVYAQNENRRAHVSAVRSAASRLGNEKRSAKALSKGDEPLLSDVDVLGLLEPAKKFDAVKSVYDSAGNAIPKRVIRSNTAARLTDRS